MWTTHNGCDGARLDHGVGDQPGDSLRPYLVGDLDVQLPVLPSRTNRLNSRHDAERRYGELRRRACAEAEHALAAAGISAELRGIDASALDASTSWADRRVAWPWPSMAADFRRGHPDRFELAIWCQDVLCGLALGRPSPGPSHLGLYFMEGNPDSTHPLCKQVTAVTLTAMNAYAAALGKLELRLVNPFPQLIPFY